MEVFSEKKITEQLKNLSKDWSYLEGQLHFHKICSDFKTAILFLNKIAVLAEKQNHHPELKCRYNQLTVTLKTNDLDGITSLDFKMAAAIDALF